MDFLIIYLSTDRSNTEISCCYYVCELCPAYEWVGLPPDGGCVALQEELLDEPGQYGAAQRLIGPGGHSAAHLDRREARKKVI